MNKSHGTEDDGLSSVTALTEFSEPPVIGHTYDVKDPAAPIFVDQDQPRVSVAEFASGRVDVRCAKPGRAGCRARPTINRTPGHAAADRPGAQARLPVAEGEPGQPAGAGAAGGLAAGPAG